MDAGRTRRVMERGQALRIMHALRVQLSWTHFQSVIYMDDPLKRDFYAEM